MKDTLALTKDTNMKTLEQIRIDYRNKEYGVSRPERPYIPADGVIDGDNTVNWNRAEVEKRKKEYKSAVQDWLKQHEEREKKLRDDVTEYIAAVLNSNNAVAVHIEDYAWCMWHSSIEEYFSQIPDLLEAFKCAFEEQ